ncbi:SDR family oxidoreductase [Nocardioides humi]|uniref:SDR family oxidoreductase n=1 Tax=Nocardioides humi TaxID=449461 RepID=A0ABN2A6R5_9ACTN|nr:SDR family oxidoreductase [Nocardioides humi]
MSEQTSAAGTSPSYGSMEGQVAVVTGGSRGIGYGIAARFRAAGADVVITARKENALRDAAERLTAEVAGPGRVLPLVAHAGDSAAADACFAEVRAELGAVTTLVNNAATNPYFGPLLGLDEARALKTVQVNQYGLVTWTRSAVEVGGLGAPDAPVGAVVNIASIGGRIVDPGIGWYNATKAAMLLLTRQLAWELGPRIRVNAIAPGVVATELAAEVVRARREVLEAQLPLRRLGTPEDIGHAALFLATELSGWMTGQAIVLDGGALALPIAVEDGATS